MFATTPLTSHNLQGSLSTLRGTSYTFSRSHMGMDRCAQPCRLPQDAEPSRWPLHVPAHVQASGYLRAAGVKQPLEQAH